MMEMMPHLKTTIYNGTPPYSSYFVCQVEWSTLILTSQSESQLHEWREKVHNRDDFTLKFTEEAPDAIIGYSVPEDQPRVVMTCGHAVDPNTLTAWCRSLLDKHEWELYCPAILSNSAVQEGVGLFGSS